MKLLLGLLSGLMAMQTLAAECYVKNRKDAFYCIQKSSYQEYSKPEKAHSIGITTDNKSKRDFAQITGAFPKTSYVGVVQVHEGEGTLLYYKLEQGKSVSPKLVYSTSIEQLSDDYQSQGKEGLLSNKYLGLSIPNVVKSSLLK